MRKEKSVFTKVVYTLLLVGILGVNLSFFTVGMPSEAHSQIYLAAIGAVLLYLLLDFCLPTPSRTKKEPKVRQPEACTQGESAVSQQGDAVDIQEILAMADTSDPQSHSRGKPSVIDLRGTDLQNADLFDANLEDANLEEADLSSANLWSANLKNGNLRKADLEGANLFEAYLGNADFTGANLRKTKLWEANFENADLTNANLQDADLRGAKLKDATLPKENLENSRYNNKTTLPEWLNHETCEELGMVFELG